MPHRKPRGLNGVVRIGMGSLPPEFLPMVLPDEKPSIEKRIAQGAHRELQRIGSSIWPANAYLHPACEASWDFELRELEAKSLCGFVELAEIAPRELMHSGYEGAPACHRVGEFADAIMALIDAKSAHYGIRGKSNLHLLLYVTHFAFKPNEAVWHCVRHELSRNRIGRGFKSVCGFMEIDEHTGILEELYPAPRGKHLSSVAATLGLRRQVFFNFDPRQAISIEGNGVMFRL